MISSKIKKKNSKGFIKNKMHLPKISGRFENQFSLKSNDSFLLKKKKPLQDNKSLTKIHIGGLINNIYDNISRKFVGNSSTCVE